MKKTRRTPVIAAGALVWRERKGRLEVLLIHRPRYDDWSWPKGKQDAGELPAVTAVREVAEETGLQVALGVPLPMLRYSTRNGRRRRPKEVHYWAATVLPDDSPAVTARTEFTPSVDEVDEVRWMTPAKAAKLLTRASDRKPLKALVKRHAAGELETRAVVVVRHAGAVSRASWEGAEAARTLTRNGATQAKALVPVLAAFGVESVLTSPWERCGATVLPYATASGLAPTEVEVLTEDSHRDTPARVATLAAALYAAVGAHLTNPASPATDDTADQDITAAVRSAVAGLTSSAGGVAVCTHRPVLPDVLGPLDDIAPGWVRKSRPRKDPYLRPASVAVVHLGPADDGARVVSLEVHSAHAT